MSLNPTVIYINDRHGPCGLVVWVQPCHPVDAPKGAHAVYIGHKVIPHMQGMRSVRMDDVLKAIVETLVDWPDCSNAELIDLDVSLLVNGDPSGPIVNALLDASMYDVRVDVDGAVGPSDGFERIIPDDRVRRALSLT